MVRNCFIFMAGTTQQEVAYAATLLHDVAQEWWVGYLRRNHGKYPRDWDTMAQAILERFGSNLLAETAQAQLQYITQGSRSVREYSAEFELHMERLEIFDELPDSAIHLGIGGIFGKSRDPSVPEDDPCCDWSC